MNESVAPVRKAPELTVTTFGDFQANCTLLEASLRNAGTDPRPDLVKLWSWIRWVNEGQGTPAHEQYLYSTSLPRVANGFLRRSFAAFADTEVVGHVVTFLRELAKHLVLRLHTTSQLLGDIEALHSLLDPAHNFYMYHGVPAWNTDIQYDEDTSLATEPPNDLAIGALVDAYRADKKTWMEGIVLAHKGDTEVYVAFFGMEPSGDRWIALDAHHIAPPTTKAQGRRGPGPVRLELDEAIPDATDGDRAPLACALLRPRVPCSRYFIDVVNAFGSAGGFQKLPLLVLPPPTSVAMVATVVSLVANVLPWVTRPLALQLVLQTEAALAAHVPEMELRSMTKPMMDTLHMSFKKICRRRYSREDAARKADEMLLDLCKRCLHSDVLEHRLHGLRCLSDFLPLIRHAKTYPMGLKLVTSSLSSAFNSASFVLISLPITEATTADALAAWCEAIGLLDLLCDAHEQLIRRAVDVVRFLCEAQRFGLPELRRLWDAVVSTSTGADVRASLFFLLESLVAWLSVPVCQELLALLQAYPAPNAHVVGLIGGIAKHAPMDETPLPPRTTLETQGGTNLFRTLAPCRFAGLQLLWRFLRNTPDDAARQLYEPAKLQLQESIDANVDAGVDDAALSPVALDAVVGLLEQCVASIGAHTDVPQALGILGYLLHLFPTDHWKLEVVRWLHARDVVQLVVDDLVAFKVALALATNGRTEPLADAVDGLNAELLRRGSHVDYNAHLKARLGFLSLLAELAPQSPQVTTAHLQVLWDALLDRAAVGAERAMLFKWLVANAMHLSADIVAFVFERLLSTRAFLTGSALSPLALTCVLVYFRLHNHLAGVIELAPAATAAPCTTNAFVVRRLPLLGMDALWTAVLEASHPTVAAHALRFVALLPFKLAPGAGDLGLVAEALTRLAPPVEQRTLGALATLVGTDVASAAALARGEWTPHSAASRGPALQLQLSNSVKGSAAVGGKVPLTAHAHDTVLQLQVAAVLALGVTLPVQQLRFFRAGREVQELARAQTLADAGFKDGDTVLVSQRPNAPVDEAPAPAVPAAVLDPALGPRLMALMETHVEAWNLLLRLPTPPAVLAAIRGHAGDWTALLDAAHPSQLLYRLQVLDGLLAAGDEAFGAAFVASGGPGCILAQFLALAPSAEPPFESYVQHECALASARLVRSFLADGATVAFPRRPDWDADLWLAPALPALLPVVLEGYADARPATVAPTPALAAWASNVDGAALHAACVRWIEFGVTAGLPLLLEGLCELLVLGASAGAPTPAVVAGLGSGDVHVRQLVAHTLVLLCLPVGGAALDPARTAAVVDVLVAAPSDSFEYFTLLGLFVLAAGPAWTGASALFEASVARVVAAASPSPTFLSDLQHAQLFGEPAPAPLQGELFVLRCVLHATPALHTFQPALLLALWRDCLFALPGDADGNAWFPRCATPAARAAAFQLVVDLVGVPATAPLENGNCELVLQQLPPLLAPEERVYEDWEWAFDPHAQMKSATGHVGLRNLGCTCYLNATLQQLFFMTRFRAAVLGLAPPAPDVVAQTRRLFAHLAATAQKAVDPTPLIQCLHDEAGQPLNVMMQQDAEEFLTRFVDGVAEYLKTQGQSLADVFGGTTCTQLRCLGGCGSVRETAPTSFVCLTVEVKGHDSLMSSLRAWSDGEILGGVNCDACGTKQDTMKRDCIDAAPATLLLHLKRFELNFDTFLREKVNDAFAFPLTLDLAPYAKAGLADAVYDLVGCVVHLGSTEAGHYYSLVLDRASGKWLELNDDSVAFFDPRLLEAECFGGPSDAAPAQLNSKSAYILVYERAASSANVAVAAPPAALVADLVRENEVFVRACYLHEAAFFTFVAAVLERLPAEAAPAPESPLGPFLHACVRVVHLYARAHVAKPVALLPLLTARLVAPEVAQSVLAHYAAHPSHVVELLLHCPKVAVRTDFAAFLAHLVVASLPLQGPLLDQGLAGASLFGKLVDQLFTFSMADALVLGWRTMTEYYTFFERVAVADVRCCELMRRHKCGMYLLDLYLGEASPLVGTVYPPYSRKRLPKVPPATTTPLLRLVAALYAGQSPATLDADTRSCLLLKTLYVRMLQSAEHARALAALVAEWATEWEAFTTSVVEVVGQVVATLQVTASTSVLALWLVLDAFLGVDDSLRARRTGQCLQAVWRSIQSHRGAQAQGQAVGVLLALGSVHEHVHAELCATVGVWGPWAGPLVAMLRTQPWTLEAPVAATGATLAWCHALSYDRIALILAANGIGADWLEAPADDDDTAVDDATAFMWDTNID
ncbi:hypothetical protein ACHHYP_09935 [Achlya hypogyna]|uniref:USP domain-containing protein n=1 Tax=Achlya hypogyna TaxID=1202772 RepID=A0A1V9YM47_ACHHY|nr:hypothetical protein ACHHYP_09935 [Achlya hypogyna]